MYVCVCVCVCTLSIFKVMVSFNEFYLCFADTEPPNNSGDADDCMVGSCKSSVEPRNTCKDNNKCGSVSSSSGNDIVIHTEANRDDISLFPALSNDAGNER